MIDRSAIEALVAGEPTARQRHEHIQVRIPRRILRRFRELMPMRGALSWFVRESVYAFVRDMEQTPHEFVAETVEHLKEDIVKGRVVRRLMEEED